MSDISPSVLIVRLDAIGDALSLAPLVLGLRERSIETGIVLREQNRDAFAPGVFERVHVAGFALRDSTRANLAAIAREGASIAPHRYTHALIASEDPGAYRLARAARIPTRIGYENGWGKPFKTLWVRSLCTQTVRRSAGLDLRAPHEAAVAFELGRSLLGSDASPSRDCGLLRPLVFNGTTQHDDRIALQVTHKWERLGAALDELVELAARLRRRYPLRAIAAASEFAYAAEFTRASGIDVQTFTDLAPWKAAIVASRAVVAPDGGGVHVAGMTGKPTVALFAQRDFALQRARWSPWAAPHADLAIGSAWPILARDALDDLVSGSAQTYRG